MVRTQGSQSLALGLTLIAAPQLFLLRYDHRSLSRNSNQTSGRKVLLLPLPKARIKRVNYRVTSQRKNEANLYR